MGRVRNFDIIRDFDINYLGHEFINFDTLTPNHFRCQTCNVLMFFDHHNLYLRINNEGSIDLMDCEILPCHEHQIKNLLE